MAYTKAELAAEFCGSGCIDRFESKSLIDFLGTSLRTLRTAS